MKLQSLLATTLAEPLTDAGSVDVTGCYVSDLLSDVLAHTRPGALWITVQVHRNVVSVATMKDITAVLITSGRKPDAATIAEAKEEGVSIYTTKLTTYEAAGKLWEAGLR